MDKERCKSEPRVVVSIQFTCNYNMPNSITLSLPLQNHKWVAFSKENQSIHFGEGEVSSTTTEEGSDTAEAVAEKENHRPSSTSIAEQDSCSEAENEKTILNELNEHSLSALIDLSTPEPPQKSVNFIDLHTPALARVHTPLRRATTPKSASSKLLHKILDPRLSITTIESDFNNMHSNNAGQSTPMVNRLASASRTHSVMSDINESAEVSEQSTIISNSVRPIANMSDVEEIPETQAEAEAEMDELFEDAEELAKSDTDLCNTTPQTSLVENTLQVTCSDAELDETGGECIPATQMQDLPALASENNYAVFETVAEAEELPTVESPLIFGNESEIESPAHVVSEVEEVISDAQQFGQESPKSPEMLQDEQTDLAKARTFTPRKSMRTPKKIDHNLCCTPKSLSKVVAVESAQRRSPRVSRMNLSLRLDQTKSIGTPSAVPKSLSKSLLVSKLHRSAKKSLLRANNRSVVEIMDDSDGETEEEEGPVAEEADYAKLLPEETIERLAGVTTPTLFENTGNDSDVIVIGSQEESATAGNGIAEEEEPQDLTAINAQEDQVKEEEVVSETEPVISSNTQDETTSILQENEGVEVGENPTTYIEEIAPTNVEQQLTAVEMTGEIMEEPEEEDIVEETIEHLDKGDQLIIESRAPQEEAPESMSDAENAMVTECVVDENALQMDSVIPRLNTVVEEMYKSPMKRLTIEYENSPKRVSGGLQKTPKSKAKADDDLRLTRSPLQNVSNMVGVRELFKTPKADAEKNLTGLRELLRTPQTVLHATTEIVGLKEMLKTPGRLFNDPSMVGVKEMLKTPKLKAPENLVGVKELLNTPVASKEANYVGVKELIKTPAPKEEPKLLGIREMMQTPKASQEVRMLGVKELLNTPMPVKAVNTVGMKEMFNTPQNTRDVNMVGVRELLKTPAAAKEPTMDARVGLREMLLTPKPGTSVAALEGATEGMSEIFKTPAPVRMVKRIFSDEEDNPQVEVVTEEEQEVEVDEQDTNMAGPSDLEPIEKESEIEASPEEQEEEVVVVGMKEEEELVLDTSAELFDKMMKRKPVTIKHTYSRQTPIKQEQSETPAKITPEKKEDVERWVESVIVASNGETKKIVNNNLQVLSDRYSNVTPNQGMKADSLFKAVVVEQQIESQSKVDDNDVKVTETYIQSPSADEMKPSSSTAAESGPPSDRRQHTEAVEEEQEKPKRGRRAAQVKAVSAVETSTPRTPLRTRRNLKIDLEDTPIASPRTRRLASVKQDESNAEVKVTPLRRGRKPKVKASVEVPLNTEEVKDNTEDLPATNTIEQESTEEPSAKPENKRPGRPKATTAAKKLADEEIVPSSTPTRRGRKPKAVEQLAEGDAELKATPTRRGRKPAPAKLMAEETPVENETEATKQITPIKRRGRGAAPKKQATVEEVSSESQEFTMEPKPSIIEKGDPKEQDGSSKPTGRGRGRRAAVKVNTSESEQTTEAEETTKAPASRGGRKKAITKAMPAEVMIDSEGSALEQKTETVTEEDDSVVKPKSSGGRRRVKEPADKEKTKETPAKKVKLSAEDEDLKIREKEEAPMLVKKPTRGRKAAAVNDSVTSTPGQSRRGQMVDVSAVSEVESASTTENRRGRGKRGVVVDEVAAASPKRAKKQESGDTDEGQLPVKEEMPKRRGRPKKQVTEDTNKSTASPAQLDAPATKATMLSRGRKAKATLMVSDEQRQDELVESEKETADESTVSLKPARGKRAAAKTAATAEEPSTAVPAEEPSRKTRATRKKN